MAHLSQAALTAEDRALAGRVDEDPAQIAARKKEIHAFHPPLDIVDGAARIVDPIFTGVRTGDHLWGQFLEDYPPTDW